MNSTRYENFHQVDFQKATNHRNTLQILHIELASTSSGVHCMHPLYGLTDLKDSFYFLLPR